MKNVLLCCLLLISSELCAQTRLVVQTGHTARVNAVAVDNNRSLVATASNDHTVRVWQITAPSTGTVLRTFSGHSGFVTDVAFNVNDETQLASCALDKTVRL
jgi:WD40 repeat protein